MQARILIILLILTGCAHQGYQYYEIDGRNLKIHLYQEEINEKAKVEALSFESLDLQKLPSDLEEFKNLQYLNLRHNKLTSIPPYIKNFSGLYALFLDDNPISKIPDEIIELRNLKVLTINGTEIKSLPNGFYNLNLRLFLVGGAPLNDLQFKEAKEKMKGTKIITSVD